MSKLLVIRHAVAEVAAAASDQGRDDAQRELTAAGRAKFTEASKGLLRIVDKIDVLATSPLLRAVQTAEILQRGYGVRPIEIKPLLPAATPGALSKWCRERGDDGCIALVGHEPGLSAWVSELLTGQSGPILQLKKGSACLIEVDFGAPGSQPSAMLLWLLRQSQLRQIGAK